MAFRLRLGYFDIELHRRDSTHGLAPVRKARTLDRQRCEGALKIIEIDAAIEQRTHQHIAGEARERVEIGGLHRFIFTY